jgi:predicted nuclease of restriction endonuclease-like RecB superfamily
MQSYKTSNKSSRRSSINRDEKSPASNKDGPTEERKSQKTFLENEERESTVWNINDETFNHHTNKQIIIPDDNSNNMLSLISYQ